MELLRCGLHKHVLYKEYTTKWITKRIKTPHINDKFDDLFVRSSEQKQGSEAKSLLQRSFRNL